MTGPREHLTSQPDLAAEFGSYIVLQVQQLEELGAFFAEALPVVEDLDEVNDRLTESGRPDLTIEDPATMARLTEPREVLLSCNNFLPNFHFYTGWREIDELDYRDQPIKERVPATTEEVLALRAMPKVKTGQELRELEASHRFPALGDNGCHAREAAFIRMLILFPDFTASLVTDMSAPEDRHNYAKFNDRLYVAYQLMSRLVDRSDLGVVDEDGTVNAWHLTR